MTKKYDLGIRSDYAVPIQNGKVEVVQNFFIGVKDSKIVKASTFFKEDEKESSHFIDAQNKVLIPGLINGHTHLPMTLYRGLEDDRCLEDWLFKRILPLEAHFSNADFVETGALLGALESVRFGVTTVCDMYYFTEVIAKVIDQVGMRALIAQPFASIPLPEDSILGSDKEKLFRSFYEKYKKHSRIYPVLGPHAPYTNKDESFKQVVRLAGELNVPIHVHLSESKTEVADSIKEFGKTPVQRLYDLNVLRRGTICAHSIHLSEEDISLLKKSGAGVVHNPDSNAKLGTGVAPIVRYLKEGIPVSLGTDGAASNNDLSLFGAMDLGTKMQKNTLGLSTAMIAPEALYCATLGGAKVLGLDKEIGSLEVGKKADLVLVDLEFPHLQPIHDLISHLVYSCQGLEVDTVVCDGKILLEDKKFKSYDLKKVFAKAKIFRDQIISYLEGIDKK